MNNVAKVLQTINLHINNRYMHFHTNTFLFNISSTNNIMATTYIPSLFLCLFYSFSFLKSRRYLLDNKTKGNAQINKVNLFCYNIRNLFPEFKIIATLRTIKNLFKFTNFNVSLYKTFR